MFHSIYTWNPRGNRCTGAADQSKLNDHTCDNPIVDNRDRQARTFMSSQSKFGRFWHHLSRNSTNENAAVSQVWASSCIITIASCDILRLQIWHLTSSITFTQLIIVFFLKRSGINTVFCVPSADRSTWEPSWVSHVILRILLCYLMTSWVRTVFMDSS